MQRKQIFISSVQREFSHARDRLASFINNDPYWSEFFYAFIFENLPASQRSPSDIYLGQIDKCAIYLGIFGLRYGRLNDDGISATGQEFDYAIAIGRDPLIFVMELTPKARRAKRMQTLIHKASGVTYTTFRNTDHLCSEVQRSLLYWQQDQNRNPTRRKIPSTSLPQRAQKWQTSDRTTSIGSSPNPQRSGNSLSSRNLLRKTC